MLKVNFARGTGSEKLSGQNVSSNLQLGANLDAVVFFSFCSEFIIRHSAINFPYYKNNVDKIIKKKKYH